MKVCETFVAFQGEINVGRFAWFLRLSDCNLQCSFCDTNYAKEESVDIKVDDLLKQAEHFNRIIITGGEPLLQKTEIANFIQRLKKRNPDVVIEIETNGTIKPDILGKFDIIYNVSPKLKNSGNEFSKRIKPSALGYFNEINANFKFVVTNEDDIDEVSLLVQDYGISKKQVFLMAEGKTREEQLDRMEMVARHAKLNGYNISPRLHVLIYGNKRGV